MDVFKEKEQKKQNTESSIIFEEEKDTKQVLNGCVLKNNLCIN